MSIIRIISGGQTGVDRAALDAAIELKLPISGWCPKGRIAELNSTIPSKYPLQEANSSDYSERTMLNIQSSDGTLILVPNMPINVTDGTILTIDYAKNNNKPHLIIDLSKPMTIESIKDWNCTRY